MSENKSRAAGMWRNIENYPEPKTYVEIRFDYLGRWWLDESTAGIAEARQEERLADLRSEVMDRDFEISRLTAANEKLASMALDQTVLTAALAKVEGQRDGLLDSLKQIDKNAVLAIYENCNLTNALIHIQNEACEAIASCTASPPESVDDEMCKECTSGSVWYAGYPNGEPESRECEACNGTVFIDKGER